MNICYVDFVPVDLTGVKKKISSQVCAFENIGFKVKYAGFFHDGYYIGDSKLINCFPGFKYLRKIVEIYLFLLLIGSLRGFDCIYLRHMRVTPWFYLFVRKLSFLNCRVFVEVPSYPYDLEYRKYSILTLFDKFFRTKMSPYVTAFSYYGSEVDGIFGRPAIKLENGVSSGDFPIVNLNQSSKLLSLIGVANISFWHGYDRLIKSLGGLSKDDRKKFTLTLVGVGPELKKLKDLVSHYQLAESVNFVGLKNGIELDTIFDRANIAVSSLGLHRINQESITPLKPAEYAARGLPFVAAGEDPRFGNATFVYKVSSDEEMIDLMDLYNWYFSNKFDSVAIRCFAESNLSWEAQMLKIKEYIERAD